MFYLYHSNDLEILKELMLEQLRSKTPSPFAQEAILVQSQGMSHWLKLQLAQGLGITAQIEFPLPSKFIWRVFNSLNPQLPERTHFDKQIMAWKLVQLLPELATQTGNEVLATYLELEQGQFEPLKCYQLAQTLADTFDQYLIYRPHWLLAWEQGADTASGKDLGVHAWQPRVWRALVENTPEELNGTLPREHRGRVHLQLEQLVKTNPQAFTHLPKRLFVFGIATLPKVYWQVLNAIEQHVDVHFYLLNPSNEFWSDLATSRQQLKKLRQRKGAAQGELHLESGNPLLASWGKLGRDFLHFVQQEGQALNEFEIFYQDPDQQPNLLNSLQKDILTLVDGTEKAFTSQSLESSHFKRPINPEDSSIRLVSAHSPLREVQRLYDQILAWLEQDSSLKPREIVVMVPDINQYAPYIDAVFSSHKATFTSTKQPYRIPWAIADQSLAAENPILDSFLSLLNLPDSRFLNSDIQDLFNVPAIARRFELNQEELELIQTWLVQAEIRWGLDGKQRSTHNLPNFNQNSWRQGLKQLLLGTVLPQSALATGGFAGDLPVFAAEGTTAETLGKLIEFIDQLESYSHQLQQPNLKFADWQLLINALIDAFYLPEEQEINSVQTIRQALNDWHTDLCLAEFNAVLPQAVVAAWFNDHLSSQTGWQRFLAGPVNFCSLMPMRSIPFKAVCMLGMNDADYPRPSPSLGFDLIQRFPEAGDRARREDDRYLFLEAITSAQQYLYLSYRGHDVRENNVQQPTVLLAELIDYLANSFCLTADQHLTHEQSKANFLNWLVEELPLQPYNTNNFAPEHPRAVPSYQHLWAQVARVETNAQLTPTNWPTEPLALPEDLNLEQILWRDVIEALTNPPQFFIRRRLQARLANNWDEQEIESNEPFTVNNLTNYQLKERWFTRLQKQDQYTANLLQDPNNYVAQALEHFNQEQQALGYLPVNELGKHWGKQTAPLLTQMAALLQPLQNQPVENRAFTIRLNHTDLIDELQEAFIHPETKQPFLLFYRVGNVRGAHLLAAWLKLLLANMHQPEITQAHFFSLEDASKSAQIQKIVLTVPDAETSAQLIQLALSWYRTCWQLPIPHLPNSLWQVLKEFQKIDQDPKKPSPEEKLDKQQEYLTQMLEQEYGELQNPYVQHCLAGFLAQLPHNHTTWLEEYAPLLLSLFTQHEIITQEDLT